MALVFTVEAGDFFIVGNERIDVARIKNKVTLRRADGSKLVIPPNDSQYELLPSVWVGIGLRSATRHLRLMIDAPKDIVIKRGK